MRSILLESSSTITAMINAVNLAVAGGMGLGCFVALVAAVRGCAQQGAGRQCCMHPPYGLCCPTPLESMQNFDV